MQLAYAALKAKEEQLLEDRRVLTRKRGPQSNGGGVRHIRAKPPRSGERRMAPTVVCNMTSARCAGVHI